MTELNPYLSTKVPSTISAATRFTIPFNTMFATLLLISTVHLTRHPIIFLPMKLVKLPIPMDPSSVGYEQNPLSVYYCYDIEDSDTHLKKCIAEVTNTPWAERVTFIFNPHSDLVAKALHVSPFMDMLGSWNIKASDPGENLSISISVHHPEFGNYFTASLKAKKLCSTSASGHALFFWLMPHKVAVWIYWHAIKLWWKNVQFIQHPRYAIPTYRDEALIRDRKLQCCGFSPQRGSNQDCLADEASPRDRRFRWIDAKWPWS